MEKKLKELLEKLMKDKFYGKLTISFKEGSPTHAEEYKTHKLD